MVLRSSVALDSSVLAETVVMPMLTDRLMGPASVMIGASHSDRRGMRSAISVAAGPSARRQQHGELISADAAEQVDLADALAAAVDKTAQRLVAGGMAQGVVDQFEMIQVNHQGHGGLARRRQRSSSRSATSRKDAPVELLGQGVNGGHALYILEQQGVLQHQPPR